MTPPFSAVASVEGLTREATGRQLRSALCATGTRKAADCLTDASFNDVSYAGLAMRGDSLGLERRRASGEEEKLGIVLSVGVGGATVTQVAQRHDVTRQQIYAWRHELKKKGLLSALPEALFLPVELDRRAEPAVVAPMTVAEEWHPARIELQLANGRCLRFDLALDATTLTQLIRVVEEA